MAQINDGIDRLHQIVHVVESAVTQGFTEQQWLGTIQYLEEKHYGYFRNESSPTGEEWAPLSEVTIKRKGHNRRLYETGDLIDSVMDSSAEHAIRNTDSFTLEFGTNRPWAAIHQEGSADGRIPQREFLGLDDQSLEEVQEIMADALEHMIEEMLAF